MRHKSNASTLPPEDLSVAAVRVLAEGVEGRADELLAPNDAANQLGITVTTFYDWLGRSKLGTLMIRGQRVTINYLQGGPKGQGRIRIERAEVLRIRDLMRVQQQPMSVRRPPTRQVSFPGITVPLGRPH